MAELNGIWAARIELRVKANTEGYALGFRGAFTTVLVRCESAEEFIKTAALHLAEGGYEISGIESLYPLTTGQFEINELIEELAERTNEYPIQWSDFHRFKGDA